MSDLTAASTVHVTENRKIATDTYRLRFDAPALAKAILPGQFVMLRPENGTDPLLARPYALYDTVLDSSGEPAGIDIVYLIVGNGTRALSRLQAGEPMRIWGPLGKPFPNRLPLASEENLLIVAGGVGQTPFPAVIQWLLQRKQYGTSSQSDGNWQPPKSIRFAYGVRSAEYFGCLEDFERHGVEVQLSTDDGSKGHRGFVTDVVERMFDAPGPPTSIFGCGPEPMLKRLAEIASKRSTPCWVSLETKMACGYGVCFSCVCPVIDDTGFDYRRVCLEGPVFRADQIAWNAW